MKTLSIDIETYSPEPLAKMLSWTLSLPWGNRLRQGVKPWP